MTKSLGRAHSSSNPNSGTRLASSGGFETGYEDSEVLRLVPFSRSTLMLLLLFKVPAAGCCAQKLCSSRRGSLPVGAQSARGAVVASSHCLICLAQHRC